MLRRERTSPWSSALPRSERAAKINSVAFYKDSEVQVPPFTQFVMNELTLTGSRANPNVSAKALAMFAGNIVKGEKMGHPIPSRWNGTMKPWTSS